MMSLAFKETVIFSVQKRYILGAKLSNLKNISKYDKNNLISSTAKNIKMYFN